MSEILPETNYPELLIGWNIGYRIGSNLDIYSLKEEDKPRLISSIKYSEIVGIEDRRGINNEIKPVLMMYLFDEEMYESENEGRKDEYFPHIAMGLQGVDGRRTGRS